MTARQLSRVDIIFAPAAAPDPLSRTAEALDWQERALCAQTDPEAFFPEKGGSTREAKKVCRACEVRAECLNHALANGERFGVWGGTTERERRKLARQADPGDHRPAASSPPRRITISELDDVRARRETGETLTAIADDYGVTHGCLSKLLNGHATPAPDPVPDNASGGTSKAGKVAA